MSNNNNNNSKPGSSAQAKLLAEFERDRSNQVDRMRTASQAGGQNFRSPGAHFGPAATDASFDQFQRTQAGIPSSPAPGPGPGLALPSSPVQWSINRRTGQPVPTSHLNSQPEHWTDEFVRLSLGHGTPVARDAKGAPLVPYPDKVPMTGAAAIPGVPEPLAQYYYAPPGTQPQYYLPDPRGAHFPRVGVVDGPPMQPMLMQQMQQMHIPSTSPMMAQMHYQSQFQQAPPTAQERSAAEAGPSHEEIKAYLDAEFEHEMNTWLDQQAAEAEATVARDLAATTATQSMATSATSLLAQQHAPVTDNQTEQQPTEVISNTELARVAQQLVNSVADNTSEKFKNSNFMELIGRIAAGDVVVANNEFVERPQAASAPAREPAQRFPDLHDGMSFGLPASSVQTSTVKPDYKGKGKAVAQPAHTDDYYDSA